MKSSKTVTALSTGSSTESLSEGIKAKEKTKKDFYRIFSEFKNIYNVLTDTRKISMSGDIQGNFDKSIKEFGVYLEIIKNDFYQKKYDAFATSLEQNLESALNEHSNVTSTNQSVIFFNNTNDSLGEVIENIRNKINTEYESSTDKVINDAQQFVWVVIVISIIGLAVSLLFGLFVRRSITAPVNDLVDMSKDIAQGEGDLTKRIVVSGKDELAELSDFFNQFLQRLNNLVIEIKKHAGNLSLIHILTLPTNREV